LRYYRLESAYDINNGLCEEFAVQLEEKIPGSEINATPTCYEFDKGWPGHYWLEYKGRCYDAECPNGVRDWKKLPIFVKFLLTQKRQKHARS